jgi:hypothetical protein
VVVITMTRANQPAATLEVEDTAEVAES